MSFFDKLNQFREAKDSAKGNDSNNDNVEISMATSSLAFESQRADSGNVDPESLSIKDLWQQAVEMHREKIEHTKAEDLLKEEQVSSLGLPPLTGPSIEEPSFMPVSATEKKEFQELLSHVASSTMTEEDFQLSDKQPDDQDDLSRNEPILKKEEPGLAQLLIETEQTQEEADTGQLANVGGQDKEEDPETYIQSLFDISPEALQDDIDQAIISIYTHTLRNGQEWLGFSLPEKELSELKESKLGKAFQAIQDVHSGLGGVSAQAELAVKQLLPLLWKGNLEREYHVPQTWYDTPLGYLFRYILSGTRLQTFDPIDVSTAATMMDWTESEVIEKYPQLGGVKLGNGYVFSRQKVKECMLAQREDEPALSLDRLEEFYTHTKQGLTKLMRVRELMNEMYDELRYVRELLLSGTDFTSNRIKLPIKIQVEHRLFDLYQMFKEMDEYSFDAMPMNRKDVIGYTVPHVFHTFEHLGGTVINAESLVRSLEKSIQLVGDERESLAQLISQLTSNLGRLSIERELHTEDLVGVML